VKEICKINWSFCFFLITFTTLQEPRSFTSFIQVKQLVILNIEALDNQCHYLVNWKVFTSKKRYSTGL
jgi:hypothetical protein